MFIGFPHCTFKCGKEVCQNFPLYDGGRGINVPAKTFVKRYLGFDITKSIVLGGLEPLDSMADVKDLIDAFREETDDPIVVYTGYNEDEERARDFKEYVKNMGYKNIIVKFGRYIPNDEGVFSEVLGVHLASSNQYAVEL
jgi:hypothetical protein